VLDVRRVRRHPLADAAMQILELFHDEGSKRIVAIRLHHVEGDYHGVTKLVEMLA
jgi:hypothetical protein